MAEQAVRLVMEDFPSPELARTLSPNGRAHWAKKAPAKRDVLWAVSVAFKRRPRSFVIPPVSNAPVRLTLLYVRPTRGRVDLDNLSTGVGKVVLDSLVRMGMLVDDHSGIVRELRVQTRYEKGRRALEITLEPWKEPDHE